MILYASDWQGDSNDNPGTLALGTGKGKWDVEIENDGEYRFEFSRWPFESASPYRRHQRARRGRNCRRIPLRSDRPLPEGGKKNSLLDKGRAADCEGTITWSLITNRRMHLKAPANIYQPMFTLHLKASKTRLTANFLGKDAKLLCGAFDARATLTK